MADGTAIEWTDATWNVVNGCTVHSPGCKRCYAMLLAGTRLSNHPSRAGLTQIVNGHHVWTGEVRFNEKVLLDPIRWRRPRRIFVCAHGDLFHESVPDQWIDLVFAVMGLAPQHQFQVLTKRAERMREYLSARKLASPLTVALGDGTTTEHPFNNQLKAPSNVWLGVSVEDQTRADERIPHLLATPAAVRWLSCEPLLGPIDLTRVFLGEGGFDPAADAGPEWKAIKTVRFNVNALEGAPSIRWGKLDWIVAGGESGPGARPMDPDWARQLRDQCGSSGAPFLFKQWGAHLPAGQVATQTGLWNPSCGSSLLTTKKNAGRMLDGVLHDGFPV
jgi:protein gp37